MIRVDSAPQGIPGTAWYLSEPGDLWALDRDQALLVSRRLARLFQGFPDSIVAMAAHAPLPNMARWLRSLADASCGLEIYDLDLQGKSARLRFRFSERWAPSFRGTAEYARKGTPTLLRKMHASTGDIDVQFGASGTLVPLNRMRTIGALARDMELVAFDQIPALLARYPAWKRYRGFFECDGDWLCVDPSGETRWFGGEWISCPTQKGPTLPVALNGFFAQLLDRTNLGPRSAASRGAS